MAAVLGMSVNISLIGTPNPLNPPSSHTPHPLHGRLRQIDDIQLATPLLLVHNYVNYRWRDTANTLKGKSKF